MAVHHKTFALEDFIAKLPELKHCGESMMYYMFPFDNLITVEFRQYNPGAGGDPTATSGRCGITCGPRAGPLFCSQVETRHSDPAVRYKVIDGFSALWRFKLENLITSDNTVATDQIIRYPACGRRQPVHVQPVGVPRGDLSARC